MRFWTLVATAILTVLSAIYLLRDLPPPDRITFAAGARDGGYWTIAEQYRDHLEDDGVEVIILETAGSVENRDLLDTRQADVGLLQGGIPTEGLAIEALGTVFIEPIIVQARADRSIPANPALWRGLTIAGGGSGSGTRAAIDALASAVGIKAANRLVDLGGEAAAKALLAGEIDMAIFVSLPDADYLQPLFLASDVRTMRLDHIEAISQRLPNSRVATIPSGAILLDPVVPDTSLQLVALMARLAAVSDLHPAIVDRLVLAGRTIHGGNDLFTQTGTFPTALDADMPIDPGAFKLLAEGQSVFHYWLPYWIAAQIRRVLLVLVPLLILIIPLFRVLPALYQWSMHRRVWRHYVEIRSIEAELVEISDRAEVEALDARLDVVDQELAAMRLPPAFRGGAYNARMHVELVRRRIADLLSSGKLPEPDASII